MNLDRIASKIVTAYGFHTYKELKDYLKRHPKADREKHWVETAEGTPGKPEADDKVPKKDQSLFQIPKSISLDTTDFDVGNSAFMKKDDQGKVKFFVQGKEIDDQAKIDKLVERAKVAHLFNTKQYTNIRLNTEGLDTDTTPDVLAIATNPLWKPVKKSHKLQRDAQPCVIIRNVKVMEKAKLNNMINNAEFTKAVPNLYSTIQKGLDAGQPEAAVLYMMTEFGVRPGTLGTKNFGAITITRKHTHDLGDKIVIKNMPMKHKNILNCEITDPRVIKIMRAGMKAGDAMDAKDNRKGFVFLPIVGQTKIDKMFEDAVGPAFTQKNIRTYIATKTAKDMMDEFFFNEGVGEKMSLEKRFELRRKICKTVSKLIHNEDSMSYGSYIDHVVFEALGIDEKWSDANPYTKIKKDTKKQKVQDKKEVERQKKMKIREKTWNGYIKTLADRLKKTGSPGAKKHFKEFLVRGLEDSKLAREKAGLPPAKGLTFEEAKKLYDMFSLTT